PGRPDRRASERGCARQLIDHRQPPCWSRNEKGGRPALRTSRLGQNASGSLVGRSGELVGSLLGFGLGHGHVGAVTSLGDELHVAGLEREEGVVAAHAYVLARPVFGAALAHDDVAGEHGFAAELLHAEALAGRVAPVARRAAGFLVCHVLTPRTLRLQPLPRGEVRRTGALACAFDCFGAPDRETSLAVGAFFWASAFWASPFLDADGFFGAACFASLTPSSAVASAPSTTWARTRADLPLPSGSTTVSTSTPSGSSAAARNARLRARSSNSERGVRLTSPSQVSVLPPAAIAVTCSTLSSWRWPRVRR